MLRCRYVLPLALALILLPALHRTTLAQADPAAGGVQAALDQLRQTPAYERSDKRADLVQLGAEAVGALAAEVRNYSQTDDANFIGQCILALQEIKDPTATDALLDVLSSTNLQLVYQGSLGLGALWAGKGGTDPAVRNVNAALLSVLNSPVTPTAFYGPASALIEINTIPIDRPMDAEPMALRKQVFDWFGRNPDRLPPVEELPWQINLWTAMTAQSDAARQDALQPIIQKGELGPIEPVLTALAQSQSLPEAAKTDLGNLLTQLTGVTFPPAGTESYIGAQQVVQWRKDWYASLAKETDQKYVDYAFAQFEAFLRPYLRDPSEATLRPVKAFRGVLFSQMSGPDEIPVGASPKAKELLQRSLEVKAAVSRAMRVLERNPTLGQKATELETLLTQVRKPQGREVGMQFLARILRLARAETNVTAAQQLGYALWQISDVPCELGKDSPRERAAALNEWLAAAKKLGLPVETP